MWAAGLMPEGGEAAIICLQQWRECRRDGYTGGGWPGVGAEVVKIFL